MKHLEKGSGYIDPTAIVEDLDCIGTDCKIWHFVHIVKGAKVGNRCNIGQNVVIMPGAVLGNGCKVQNNVSLYTGVECEDDVFIGPSAVFTNVINPRAFIERKDEYRITRVAKGASIGANATIVCGVRIGRYALIGAGAVITKDVADYALMAGNPAKQIGWVSQAGYRLEKSDGKRWVCPITKTKYLETQSGLVPI